ncbi:MAG: PAAR domain-containing protein [Polyangiaceae bacterium]
MTLEQAARLDDPIEHTRSALGSIVGGLLGLAVGIALAAATIATGGLALAVVVAAVGTAAGVTVLGSTLGELAGKLFHHTPGDIDIGSQTVFVGHPTLNAARATDPVKCHSGEKIRSGCRLISIEQLPAARATEETTCAGKIKKDACCPTVWYGGPSVAVLPVRPSGELPTWMPITRDILGIISLIGGGVGLWSKVATAPWATLATRWQRIERVFDIGSFAMGVADTGFDYFGRIAGGETKAWVDSVRNSTAYQVINTGVGVAGAGKDIATTDWRGTWNAMRGTDVTVPPVSAPDVAPPISAPDVTAPPVLDAPTPAQSSSLILPPERQLWTPPTDIWTPPPQQLWTPPTDIWTPPAPQLILPGG